MSVCTSSRRAERIMSARRRRSSSSSPSPFSFSPSPFTGRSAPSVRPDDEEDPDAFKSTPRVPQAASNPLALLPLPPKPVPSPPTHPKPVLLNEPSRVILPVACVPSPVGVLSGTRMLGLYTLDVFFLMGGGAGLFASCSAARFSLSSSNAFCASIRETRSRSRSSLALV